MVPDTVWHIFINKQDQLIYYAEKPDFSFTSIDSKGKKIYSKTAIWNPIQIEFPTRPIPVFKDWIDKSIPTDIFLVYSLPKRVIDKYLLEGATIERVIGRLSKVLGVPVLTGTVTYKYSRRVQ